MENSQLNELEKLKKIELDILKQFIKICDELNLSYFAVGGTLIGAVRHKGFIPWDDDIDVSMPRRDYDIFVEKAAGLLDGGYFLQTSETDEEFPMNYAKLRNSNTAFIEKALKNLNINHGIYIDIFPLDKYPENKSGRILLKLKNSVYFSKMNEAYYFEKSKDTLKIKFIHILSNIFCRDIKDALKKRGRLIRKYNNTASKLITNYSGAYGEREVVSERLFEDFEYKDFEDIKIRVPKGYDEYLKNIYGDYMALPPKEKQKPHHDFTVLDFEKSYLEYKTEAEK